MKYEVGRHKFTAVQLYKNKGWSKKFDFWGNNLVKSVDEDKSEVIFPRSLEAAKMFIFETPRCSQTLVNSVHMFF